MTREEAISTLANFKRYISGSGVTDLKANEALDMAIEALQTPPISQRRMYQLGYRQAQEDRARGHWMCALADRVCSFQGKEFAWCLTCPHISEEDRVLVKKTIAEPKTGKWIDEDGTYYANCSKCGYQMHTHQERGYFRFCPNCGADMKGSEDE